MLSSLHRGPGPLPLSHGESTHSPPRGAWGLTSRGPAPLACPVHLHALRVHTPALLPPHVTLHRRVLPRILALREVGGGRAVEVAAQQDLLPVQLAEGQACGRGAASGLSPGLPGLPRGCTGRGCSLLWGQAQDQRVHLYPGIPSSIPRPRPGRAGCLLPVDLPDTPPPGAAEVGVDGVQAWL